MKSVNKKSKKQLLEGLSEKATRSINFSEPLWGCHYHAPIGLTQTSGIAGDFYLRRTPFPYQHFYAGISDKSTPARSPGKSTLQIAHLHIPRNPQWSSIPFSWSSSGIWHSLSVSATMPCASWLFCLFWHLLIFRVYSSHSSPHGANEYAIIDESIVWYGSVDFLAFGRKDTDVLRFENPDIAGELLAISEEANGEQLMIEDIQT